MPWEVSDSTSTRSSVSTSERTIFEMFPISCVLLSDSVRLWFPGLRVLRLYIYWLCILELNVPRLWVCSFYAYIFCIFDLHGLWLRAYRTCTLRSNDIELNPALYCSTRLCDFRVYLQTGHLAVECGLCSSNILAHSRKHDLLLLDDRLPDSEVWSDRFHSENKGFILWLLGLHVSKF